MPLFGSEKDFLVKVIFGIDDAKYKAGLKGIETSTSQAEKKIVSIDKSIKGMGNAVKWFMGLAAVGMMTKWFIDTAKMAAEAEAAQHDFIASMKLTGRYSKETADDLTKFAEGLRQVVKVSDEEAKSAMSLAMQLTNLDKESIKNLTKSAIGLSSTIGMDLFSAMRLLIRTGEGLTNTIRGTTIEVDKNLKGQERWNSLFEQTKILYEMAGEKLKTYEGRVWSMNEAYKEMRERLGEQIISNKSLGALYEGLAKLFDDLVKDTGDGTSVMSRSISSFVDFSVSALLLLARTIQAVSFAWNNLQRYQAGREMQKKTAEETQWESVLNQLNKPDIPMYMWDKNKPYANIPQWQWALRSMNPSIRQELKGMTREQAISYATNKLASLGPGIGEAIDKFDAMDKVINKSLIDYDKIISDLKQIRENAKNVSGEIDNLTHSFKKANDEIGPKDGKSTAITTLLNIFGIGRLPGLAPNISPQYPSPTAVDKYGIPYAIGEGQSQFPYLGGLSWALPHLRKSRGGWQGIANMIRGKNIGAPQVGGGEVSTDQDWLKGNWLNIASSAYAGYQQGGGRGAISAMLPIIGSAFGPVGTVVGGILSGIFGRKKQQGETKVKPIYAEITNFGDFWKLGTTLPSSFVLSGRANTKNVDPHGRSAMLDWMVTGHQSAEFYTP